MAKPKKREDTRTNASELREEIQNEEGLQPVYSPSRPRWLSKIGITATHEVVGFLKLHLRQEVMDLFKQTLFKQFIECRPLRLYAQLFHRLIQAELKQPNPDIIKIAVRGKVLDFTLEHFVIISGLPAVPQDKYELMDTKSMSELTKLFCAKYFKDVYPSIRIENLENAMKAKEGEDLYVGNNEDLLNIALVYFICFYILGTNSESLIPNYVFNCVLNGDYNKVAWGRLSFKETLSSLKREGGTPKSYRLKGCPAIYQTWFFKVCGACRDFLAERIVNDNNEFRLRIFNWDIYSTEVTQKDLSKKIFKRDVNEINICPFEPTKEESDNLLKWKNASKNEDTIFEGEIIGIGLIDGSIIVAIVEEFKVKMNNQLEKVEVEIDKWNVKLDSLQQKVAEIKVNKDYNEKTENRKANQWKDN